MKKIQRIFCCLMSVVIALSLLGCSYSYDQKDVATDVAAEDEFLLGTYVGENGSVLIIRDGGEADYFYRDYSDMKHNNSWSYSDSKLSMHIGSCYCDVYANIGENPSSFVLVADGTLYEFLWDDERYNKVSDNIDILTASECNNLLADNLQITSTDNGTSDENANDIEYENIEYEGISLSLPAGGRREDNDGFISIYYGNTAFILLKIIDAYALSNYQFFSIADGDVEQTLNSIGSMQITSHEDFITDNNYVGRKYNAEGNSGTSSVSGIIFYVNFNSNEEGKVFIGILMGMSSDNTALAEYDNIIDQLNEYTTEDLISSGGTSNSRSANNLVTPCEFNFDDMHVGVSTQILDNHIPNDTYNLYTLSDNYKYLFVQFGFTNNGNTDEFVSSADVQCYADGVLCTEQYIPSDTVQSFATISPGRQAVIAFFYAVPVNAQNIELEYQPNIFVDESVIITVGDGD